MRLSAKRIARMADDGSKNSTISGTCSTLSGDVEMENTGGVLADTKRGREEKVTIWLAMSRPDVALPIINTFFPANTSGFLYNFEWDMIPG